VRFSGYALRQASPEELAAKIVAAAQQAAAQVDQRMEQLVSPLLPAGTTFEQLAGTAPDLTRLLPEDPTARVGGG
jgi:hypothetical protein